VADLNPTDPASVFRIVAVSNRPPTNTVCFRSSSNRVYALALTTNLMAPGAWTNVTGVTNAGNGGIYWLTATNSTPSPFYRVQVEVP